MFHKKNDNILIRTVTWPVDVDDEQLHILRKVSDHHWQLWGEAIEERQQAFEMHLASLYAELKTATERKDATEVKRLKAAFSAGFKYMPDVVKQINALTSRRGRDPVFARMPRNWQEETLKIVEGAYKSFMALRKAGDTDARPPRRRSEWEFCEIRGRTGFRVLGDALALSLGGFAGCEKLLFPIKSYQRAQLALAQEKGRLKSFSLYRKPRDMREDGRFWISVSFELPRPEAEPFNPQSAVYVALGASYIGVVSPAGEETIALWRPDRYWKEEIDHLDERMKAQTKGSRRWQKRNAAKQKKFRKMAGLQKHDRRNLAVELIEQHGIHFVVSEVVVRSKKGRLADGSKPERGGALGLNWSAQNTGSFQMFVAQLREKAREHGGSLREHRIPRDAVPDGDLMSREKKTPMARALRDSFLRSV